VLESQPQRRQVRRGGIIDQSHHGVLSGVAEALSRAKGMSDPAGVSDWAPLGMLLELIGTLMLSSVFMPSNEAVERAREVAHDAVNQQQQAPMVGTLVEPQLWRD
jgi:hypothetical protein